MQIVTHFPVFVAFQFRRKKLRIVPTLMDNLSIHSLPIMIYDLSFLTPIAPMSRLLGIVEILAAISLAQGIFPQIGAVVVIFTMLGAIQKKALCVGYRLLRRQGLGLVL